jgi:hypothetical protein
MPESYSIREFDNIDFSDLEKEYQTEEQISRYIDSLDISSEAKLMISKISVTTVNAGKKVIKVGKKIIEIMIFLAHKFPNMFIGMILSSLLLLLIVQIPLIGNIIVNLVGPLVLALGLTMGAIQDFRDNAFAHKLGEAISIFEPLKTTGN